MKCRRSAVALAGLAALIALQGCTPALPPTVSVGTVTVSTASGPAPTVSSGTILASTASVPPPPVSVGTILVPTASAPAAPTVSVGTILVPTASPPAAPRQGPGGGECDHEYFPVDLGATWVYANTDDIFGERQATNTITETRDDGFTMTTTNSTDDVVLNLEYGCRDGALTLFDPMKQLSAGSAIGPAIFVTQSQSGITLPSELRAGLTWQQAVKWTATALGVSLSGTYDFDNVAAGPEAVTVPMGTFEAMRVDTEALGTLEGEDFGSCQVTTWYVRQIGVVKSTTTCNAGVNAIEISTNLESYDSP